jgi:hypothetical protein
MENSENNKSKEASLYQRYSDYTDEQIFGILRKRWEYQDVAVETAVKIALDRKLINSTQDLLAPEYQNRKSPKKTLFPEINNTFHRNRLVNSIFRFLYLMTVLPLAYGIFSYGISEISQAMLGFGVGLIWFVLCLLLKKTKNNLVFIPLFLMLFGACFFSGYQIFQKEIFQLVDTLVLGVCTFLPLYLMFYLRKLMTNS